MVTVHREGGFRMVIYTQDHEPAHVHGDGDCKIDIVADRHNYCASTPLSKRDANRVTKIVAERRAMLLARWSEIHG